MNLTLGNNHISKNKNEFRSEDALITDNLINQRNEIELKENLKPNFRVNSGDNPASSNHNQSITLKISIND